MEKGAGGVGAGAEDLALPGGDPNEERFGLRVVVEIAVNKAEFALRRQGKGMVGTEFFRADAESSLEERFGLFVSTEASVEEAQIAQARCRHQGVGALCPFPDFQGAGEIESRLFILASAPVERCEIVDGRRRRGGVGAEAVLSNGQCGEVELLGFGKSALVLFEHAEAIEHLRHRKSVRAEEPLPDAEGLIEQGACPVVIGHVCIEPAEFERGGGDGGIVGPLGGGSVEGEGLLKERLGLSIGIEEEIEIRHLP